jgi:hypothetical protein
MGDLEVSREGQIEVTFTDSQFPRPKLHGKQGLKNDMDFTLR